MGRQPLTPERWSRIERLLEAVLDLDPAARAELLDAQCADEPDLRREVEELLAAGERAPELLDAGAAAWAAPAWDGCQEAVDPPDGAAEVGPYRLLGEIGRGGMSRVYAAERRDEQLHRRVALKRFAGTGWMRDDLRRRFRAEGRALALLSHPHIAQVFDAGVDAAGEPYLAMELIDGEPITEHAAARSLDLPARIDLFLGVCAAVEHAHRHLVVHRDLKPSNILVDREGRVKLLDFGIAKLLDPALLEDESPSPRTRTGLLPMTPEYAAPEQVRGEEITTATDVYALGLLLYELLTGRRAYEIEGRSPAEIERVVCGAWPTRPSSVVALAPPLRRRLRGDLDTIVLTALRKEPEDRYPSAAALADDLRRYLRGLPVTARPASPAYRVGKFARRHRGPVAAGVVALGAILLFAATAFLQQREATRQRDLARFESETSRQVTEFLLDLFESSDPSESKGEETSARELLQRGTERIDAMDGRPEVQARMLDVLGRVYGHLGSLDRAEVLLRRALDVERGRGAAETAMAAAIEDHLAAVRLQQGDYDEAIRLFGSALARRERELGPQHPAVASSLNNLAVAMKEQGSPRSAEPLYRRALEIYRGQGEDHLAQNAETELNLGVLLTDLNRFDEAEPLLREALATFERIEGPIHPRIADAANALANLLVRRGHLDEADPLLHLVVDQRRRLFGDGHPQVAQALNDLAVLLENRGRLEEAGETFRRALATYERSVGPDHLAVAIAASNVAGVDVLVGRFDEAESLYRRALDIVERQLGPENRYAPRRWTGIAMALHGRGERAEAEPYYRRALEMAQRLYPADSPAVAFTQLELGRLLIEERREHEAESLLRAAHASYAEAFGDRHARTARAAAWLGICLLRRGQPAEGRALLTSALALQRELLPSGHPHREETERAWKQLGEP